MYIPPVNLMKEQKEALKFMKRFSFATIISTSNNFPTATHLPFLTSVREDKIILTSHFARANSQWQLIEQNNSLVIFTEPHAYISPINYEKELNVPTWNYMSVHAYGKGKIINDENEVRRVLEMTIDFYEQNYQKQWSNLPEEYKNKLSNGIVAFEIEVNDLQGKKKLSQNRSAIEQETIIHSLSKSEHGSEKLIAEYMKEIRDHT